MVAANFQARVAENRTPAIDYVNALFRNPSVLQWLQGRTCRRRAR
jgi:hypothetical protein